LDGHAHVTPEGEQLGQPAKLFVLTVTRQHFHWHVDAHAAVVHAPHDDATQEVVGVE
jgi:hypothetical protein